MAEMSDNLVALARRLCGGRIVAVLEGGYDLDALGYGSLAVARALLGDKTVSDPLGPSTWAEEDVTSIVEALRRLHDL